MTNCKAIGLQLLRKNRMKKIYLLIFSFSIFLLSFNSLSVKAYAITENLSASVSSKPESKINYELPYPGLLPDSPLYFLRIIRDRTVSFLISDPLKKAEFNLLQSDKRLNAGIYLFNKGKNALAISTISKAENYFEEAISKMEEAKRQGRDVNGITGSLKNASEKHQQELGSLVKKASGDSKTSFENEQKRVIDFEQRLSH